MKLGLVRRSERAGTTGTTDYMHSLLAQRGTERALSESWFVQKGGACLYVRVCVCAPCLASSSLTRPLARLECLGERRASPMYFLPWIEAINLLKCSWPDILLVPLIDGLLAGSLPPPLPSHQHCQQQSLPRWLVPLPLPSLVGFCACLLSSPFVVVDSFQLLFRWLNMVGCFGWGNERTL